MAVVLSAFTAKAQQDYVITTNGDSIKCKINIPFIGSPKYKIEGSNESKKIKADSVNEYYTADKSTWYRRVFYDPKGLWVRNKVCFMTVVESGKINLYELITDYNNVTITGWYASKGTNTVILIKETGLLGNRKRRDFETLIADNKAVYEKYTADDKFGFDKIRNLVHLYNTTEPYK